jgi:hypothetical protein
MASLTDISVAPPSAPVPPPPPPDAARPDAGRDGGM